MDADAATEREPAPEAEAASETKAAPETTAATEAEAAPESEPAPEIEAAPEAEAAPESEAAPEAEAAPESEAGPEAETALAVGADGVEAAPRRRRVAYGRWLWLVAFCLCAAVLGLAVGVGAALRGRSFGSGVSGGAVARPTFVIGAAVSPVPSSAPSPVVARPAPTPAAATAEYVVQPGDTLRSIAQHIYGDADQWPRIYDANRDLIGPDPDALQAGMRLRTP